MMNRFKSLYHVSQVLVKLVKYIGPLYDQMRSKIKAYLQSNQSIFHQKMLNNIYSKISIFYLS